MHSETVHSRRSMGLLLIILAGLAGCAQQPRVTSTWAADAPRNQPYSRVLVVGVSPDLNQRCAFEHFLASRLQSDSVQAVTSCRAVANPEPLTRESIDAAIQSQGADAVLATLLVSKKWDTQDGGSRDTRGGAYYKATDSGYASGYYGAYGVPVIYGEFQTAPSVLTMQGEVRVTSKFYETRGATLVYTLDTVARDLESRDSGLAKITTAIADRVHRDGLLR